MRRQTTTSRVLPAGSSPIDRLDPFSLPLRFALDHQPADARLRLIEIDRERVVLCRALCGMKMTLVVPVTTYLGVAVHMDPPLDGSAAAVAVVLEHPDPALSLTMFHALDGADIVAEWQSWGRALGLPLLVAEADGASARAVWPHRQRAHRPGDRAAPQTNGARSAASVDAAAPAHRHHSCGACPASRRARDHRTKIALIQRGLAQSCNQASLRLFRKARSVMSRQSMIDARNCW